jgi:hypothetical protein
LRPTYCILDFFLRPERWQHECELVDIESQEYLQAVPTRRGTRLGQLEASCRFRGHLAQSPSGGLWHVGGVNEVSLGSTAAEQRLGPRGVVPWWHSGRHCLRVDHRHQVRHCLRADLRHCVGMQRWARAALAFSRC